MAAFLGLALAYAYYTPPWQAPDEPAHYAFVQFLAERGQLPVLVPGDYPVGDPPGPRTRLADISAYRYESHQPPLYYALEAVDYKLAGGNLFALRALTAVLGMLVLPLVFVSARLLLPREPWLWLATTALVAFIPMHLFDDGTLSNDALADLVTAAMLVVFLALARGWQWRWRWLLVGTLAGLAVLTKLTAYAPVGLLVLLAAAFAPSLATPVQGSVRVLWAGVPRRLGVVVLTAAAISGWWLLRNGLTYGWGDSLAQTRQKIVAASQVQTGGLAGFDAGRFIHTSFNSFWGQFGWMSVPLPQLDYEALLALTGLAVLGWYAVSWQDLSACRRAGRLIVPPFEVHPKSWAAKTCLADLLQAPQLLWTAIELTFVSVVAEDVYYNLTFVQPQGRYLYPALIPIALFYVGGLAALTPRRAAPLLALVLCGGMLLFAVVTLRQTLIPAFGT
ncbi:MAG: DUF2142 domain-containing protein [Chloroflexi bacterium]|nr:DUF2142 domain-containing protein [Chloroflexota bacterium]